MPPRTPGTSNFPPPPRRTPAPNPTKSNFPRSPGAARYSQYMGADRTSWSTTNDDTQTRKNAYYNTWEKMTHAHGPQTQGRKVPPPPRDAQPAKPSSFQPGHESTNETPKAFNPRTRPGWEQPQGPNPASPGLSRSNTTHVPRKNGFTPSTPGGDEPAARNTSAYYNVSRGAARPQAPRAETQFPPPPPRTTPTSQKPAPPTPNFPRSFRPPSEYGDPFGNSDRISTPYATSGGEKTYFSSTSIGRSASTRSPETSAKSSGGFPPNVASPLSPGTNGRHRSASPQVRSPHPQRSYSPSSSSGGESYSSDEGGNRKRYSRRASADHLRPTTPPTQAHRRPSYQHVRPEDVDLDEKYSQSKYNSARDFREKSGSNRAPKPYATSQPTSRNRSPSSDTPEGFLQHRMKREAERARRPASPLQTSSSWNGEGPGRPLEKSKSWQEKFGSKEGGNNQRDFDPPTSGDTKETRPMYESPEHSSFPYIPLSFDSVNIDSPQNSKRPRTSSWPYWAIPSSIKPSKQVEAQNTTQTQSSWNQHHLLNMMRKANFKTFNSFNCKINDDTSSASPIKSPSVENINTNFSPSGWPGTFTSIADEHVASTNGHRFGGRASPPKGRPHTQGPPRGHPMSTSSTTQEGQSETAKMPPPPTIPIRSPSPGQAKFAAEEWQQHFKEPNWAFPPPQQPAPSPRVRDPRRPKTPRTGSTTQKRTAGPKPASVSNEVDDADDDAPSNGADNVIESELSQSSSGSAMDIDPTFTPPSDQKSQEEQRHVDTVNVLQPTSSSKQPGFKKDSKVDTDLNLGNLKNVAPIAPNKSGLGDLDDLNTTLPFESRRSNRPARPLTPQRLDLPNPPKAPVVPGKLTQSSFDYYIVYMRAYMVEWNVFNKRMLAHFTTRQEEVENKLGNDWIGAVGEEGYAKYMRGVEEDFRVREHWNVSWERHKGFMENLGQVRERAVTGKLTV